MEDSSAFESLDAGDAAVVGAMPRLAGMLVEIVVLDVDADAWALTVDWMRREQMIESFTSEDSEVAPSITPAVFSDPDRVDHQLAVRFGGCLWTSGLAEAEVIDLQCNSEEISSEQQVQQIRDVMRSLARLVGKRVLLVPESLHPSETTPLLTTEPE